MKVLDLFSGIGGFSLALDRCGMQTVAFCEADLFCTKILNKHWPDVPVYSDIRKLNGKEIGTVQIVCGGFPCQPWSGAGKGKGHTDDRDLWPEMLRVVREVKPRWVLAENVQGFVNKEMGLRRTVSDLEGEDYEVRVFTIPACGVKAPHQRYRAWIVGYSKHNGSLVTKKSRGCSETQESPEASRTKEARESTGTDRSRDSQDVENSSSTRTGVTLGTIGDQGRGTSEGRAESIRQGHGEAGTNRTATTSQDVADSEQQRPSGQGKHERSCNTEKNSYRQTSWLDDGCKEGEGHWDIEPNVGRVAHGVPKRVDRLKSLGNAVVPQIVEIIGRAILKTEEAF